MGKHDRDKDRKRVKQSQKEAKAADKTGDRSGHHAAKAHGQPARVDDALPPSRDELLALHGEARRRRASAPYNSPEHHAAIDEIGRIEVRIADVERSMTPPRG
jgi:hypothetical protein